MTEQEIKAIKDGWNQLRRERYRLHPERQREYNRRWMAKQNTLKESEGQKQEE